MLIVEDDPDTVASYSECFRRARCDVRIAMTKSAGASAARAERPDVIVLDCRLPDGDGLELLADLRRDRRLNGVPVVVVTASKERQDLEAAILARATSFVPKPCTNQSLIEHVRRAVKAAATPRSASAAAAR